MATTDTGKGGCIVNYIVLWSNPKFDPLRWWQHANTFETKAEAKRAAKKFKDAYPNMIVRVYGLIQ